LRHSVETAVLLLSAFFLVPSSANAQAASALPDAPGSSAASPAQARDSAPIDLPATFQNKLDEVTPQAYAPVEAGGYRFDAPPATNDSIDPYVRVDEAAAPGAHIDLTPLFKAVDRPFTGSGVTGAGPDQKPEHYHWKETLWESFAFFGMENSFRLMTDEYMRHLTVDKPFWHDYFASVKQWNWRRWDDGDDFLVAYIAHPLQGSVTEFIEIQNDPNGRDLRIGDGSPYWHSRFRAFLWNTLYSTDQKIGPLGEAALGSEGGYNYIIHCTPPCKQYNPKTYKVTNNTGWVKLVTTPVVGDLWTIMEDSLDRYVSDPIEDKFGNGPFAKIVRGSLNPTRTLANALRWRKPWYRDYEHDTANLRLTPKPHFLPGDDAVIRAAPKYEIFTHFNALWLPVNTATCTRCRELTTGYGFGFARRLAPYADWDSDLDFQPNASPFPSDRAGGSIISGTFGLRSGYSNAHFALKGSLRPGFLSYDKAYETSPSATNPTPNIGRITHFTTVLALNGDYYVNRHLGLRFVAGNMPVRYREPYIDPKSYIPGTYPYLTWLSPKEFLSNENWTYQTGAILRF
jgi:hypothetical protein